MAGKRKVHTAAFKAQVALAALKGDKTVNELAGHYGARPTLIHGWKKQLLSGAESVFGNPAQAASADAEARQAELFEQIGRLKMELEWLKKKLPSSCEHKRTLVEPGHPALSARRQCELLGLSRSGLYYESGGESAEDLRLMRLIDEQYTARPFYGSRRMTIRLNGRGEGVNRKRVRRLMRVMGLEAIYPKPRLSLAGKGHLTVGENVRATVTRTEVYGVYLTHQGRDILVLIPEVAWVPVVHDCRDFARPGDEFDVKILGMNEQEGIYGGSIKDARPEDDPWRDRSAYHPGVSWSGRVTHLITGSRHRGGLFGYIVELRPGVSGLIRSGDAGRSLSVGDRVDVVIAEVDLKTKKIRLMPSPRS